MSPPLVEARGLKRAFDRGAVQALRGIDLTIQRGEFVAIMGPSGCGKSTLLHALGALDGEFQGALTIDGTDVQRLPCPEQFRARVIGFVFQSFHLLPTLTALENVQVPMFEMPWSKSQRRERARELLVSMGLADRLHHFPSRLSGGERQRVAIARSLANRPQLVLADEPTGNLDSVSATRILDLLRSIHTSRRTTVIVVTHDTRVAERADRTLHMLDGRIVDPPPAPSAPSSL